MCPPPTPSADVSRWLVKEPIYTVIYVGTLPLGSRGETLSPDALFSGDTSFMFGGKCYNSEPAVQPLIKKKSRKEVLVVVCFLSSQFFFSPCLNSQSCEPWSSWVLRWVFCESDASEVRFPPSFHRFPTFLGMNIEKAVPTPWKRCF